MSQYSDYKHCCWGSMYQDLGAQRSKSLIHEGNVPRWYPTHEVEIQPRTMLFKILGKSHLRVNSYHHLSVRKEAPNFRICARAKDGVIEAIENPSLRFALGIQWHPEEMRKKDSLSKRIFAALIKAAKNRFSHGYNRHIDIKVGSSCSRQRDVLGHRGVLPQH